MSGSYIVGDLVADFLEACGITAAFGIISVHNIPILNAISKRSSCRFVMARGEMGAEHMADTYARVTNGLAVLVHPHAANYFYSEKIPRRSGNRHSNIAPHDSFKTATSPIFLAVGNDQQFKKLVSLLGKPELAADDRFRSNADRVASHSALKCELEELLTRHDGMRLAAELARIGVPSGAVRTIDEALTDTHTKFRNMVVELDDYRGTASPIKMSRSQPTYRLKPPRLGEHNDEVVTKLNLPPVNREN